MVHLGSKPTVWWLDKNIKTSQKKIPKLLLNLIVVAGKFYLYAM